MRTLAGVFASLSIGLVSLTAQPVLAAGDTVKITPLGSHDGEFCQLDRAMIFEDPNGARILYDAGRTVRGPSDPRLGVIHGILLSHVHGDHLGDRHAPGPNEGSCGSHFGATTVMDTPNSNTANIAVAQNAEVIVGGEMNFLLTGKVIEAGGEAAQVKLVRFGATYNLGGVKITTVPASHSNGLDRGFINTDLANLLPHSMTLDVGPPTGYVIQFTNGLVVYLSGDTGITAEQDRVVRDYYHANLAVINIGDTFTTGPTEAAHVINNLVKPRSVIPSHANEGATAGGKVQPGTKTAAFINAVRVPAHVPLSGQTMEFDSHGKCVFGC